MSEGMIGIIVLCSLSVVSAVVCHAVISRYVAANIVASAITNILFQIAAYYHVGYLDPFFLIGLAFGFAYGFAIAAIVGAPFAYVRKRRRWGRCRECGYDLTGNVSGRCPECGTEIPRAIPIGHE